MIIDRTVAVMSDFAAGAIDGKHYFGINWDRDVATPEGQTASMSATCSAMASRTVKVPVFSAVSKWVISSSWGASKYSEAMKAAVQGEDGNRILTMGCCWYGIKGDSRGSGGD